MPQASRELGQPAIIDDIDAITPCPLTRSSPKAINESEIIDSINKFQESRSPSPCSECSSDSTDASRSRRRESLKALEEGTEGDPERLWERMLALQQIYGCYNSARMSAALSSGDVSLLLPSKACLNLLNENMSFLPDETGRVFRGWKPNAGSRRSH
ncbi:hypothetical protein F4813DRAFT_215134 [Daldinia decipiens]|uniref:uncharacterized protein n=1 Tax=Daldinia decipiens TaxID=326647 RepID=UPI0020C501BB|nr:uncharacterized protein F4813DRAFT_215134 [Daldinia decipiens]KAI1654135.1 hypothetical protein F4813DRAFT_215134 [Daldinia decipiens]